jgi:hypothetical protein
MTPTPMETTQDTGSDAGRSDEPGIPSNAPRMLVRLYAPTSALILLEEPILKPHRHGKTFFSPLGYGEKIWPKFA